MRFARVQVKYRGQFLIFGLSPDALEKAAQTLRKAVSRHVGEKVLPLVNVSVFFSEAGRHDLMAKDLEVLITATSPSLPMGAETLAKNVAKDFFDAMGGIGVGTTALFTVDVPRSTATHTIS